MAHGVGSTNVRIPRTLTGLFLTILGCFIIALVIGFLALDGHSPAFMPFVSLVELGLIGVIAWLCYRNRL